VELLVSDDVLDRVDRRPEEIRFARKDFRPFIEWLGSEDLVELYRSDRQHSRRATDRWPATQTPSSTTLTPSIGPATDILPQSALQFAAVL